MVEKYRIPFLSDRRNRLGKILENVDWNVTPVNIDQFSTILRQIADDFLLGKDNSVCRVNNPITGAKPLNFQENQEI